MVSSFKPNCDFYCWVIMFLSQETRSGHYTVAQTLTNQHFLTSVYLSKLSILSEFTHLPSHTVFQFLTFFFLFYVYWCVIMSASKETWLGHLLLHKLWQIDALILLKTLALYKPFTYLLTYTFKKLLICQSCLYCQSLDTYQLYYVLIFDIFSYLVLPVRAIL